MFQACYKIVAGLEQRSHLAFQSRQGPLQPGRQPQMDAEEPVGNGRRRPERPVEHADERREREEDADRAQAARAATRGRRGCPG